MRVFFDMNVFYNFFFEMFFMESFKSFLFEFYEFYVSILIFNELFYLVIWRKVEIVFEIYLYRKFKEFFNKNGYKFF